MTAIVQDEAEERTVMAILLALSFGHMLNDMIQSLLPSIYPILKDSFALDFTQIGLITLTYQMTASLLQPMVGIYTDKHPQPYSLPFGMGLTMAGLVTLSHAAQFSSLLIGAALVGSGSAIFHPEASRMARAASGGKHGFAQSVFQMGGTAGASVGPLMAAYIILPHGQQSILWFTAAALLGMIVLSAVGRWYNTNHLRTGRVRRKPPLSEALPRRTVALALGVLLMLMFSKFFYITSLNSYYTFYLIHKFGVEVQTAQIMLFVFLAAGAAGTFFGGPIGDRFGRKRVIWCSIFGTLPFSLLLPHVGLVATGVLSFFIGAIISSAFSAIIVYAQELLPGKPGTVGGLFFGLAFGMAGVSAALLGRLADATSIEHVYNLCAWLPLLGIFTVFLPDMKRKS